MEKEILRKKAREKIDTETQVVRRVCLPTREGRQV